MGWYIGTMKSKLKNDIQKVIASCSSKKQNVYLTPLDVNLKKKMHKFPCRTVCCLHTYNNLLEKVMCWRLQSSTHVVPGAKE